MSKAATRMEVPPTPEVLGQDGVVLTEADPKNPGVIQAVRLHPLERLYKPDRVGGKNTITEAQYDAGMKFATDYDIAAASPSASHHDGVAPPKVYHPRTPPMSVKRMEARVRVQEIKRFVGPAAFRAVEVICGEGHSVAEFASRRGMSAHQATGYLIAALDRLSEYYGG